MKESNAPGDKRNRNCKRSGFQTDKQTGWHDPSKSRKRVRVGFGLLTRTELLALVALSDSFWYRLLQWLSSDSGTGRDLMQPYDRSSKWLIEHHGAAILRLAGVTGIVTCRSAQAEVVQPRQMIDGILEVTFDGRDQSDWFVVEVATDPERRDAEQALRGALMVFLNRRVMPEVVTIVLRPKGAFHVSGQQTFTSRLQLTNFIFNWRVIELWNVPAEQLLAANEVGLVPWVPLCHYEGPPEPILQECRKRIDEQASPQEHDNLLAVTQVLMQIWYNDPRLFMIFGGKQIMDVAPWFQEFVAARVHGYILDVLKERFGSIPADIDATLRTVVDDEALKKLNRAAAVCQDLSAFRKHLPTATN